MIERLVSHDVSQLIVTSGDDQDQVSGVTCDQVVGVVSSSDILQYLVTVHRQYDRRGSGK